VQHPRDVIRFSVPKGALAVDSAVDKLVNDHNVAGRKLLTQRSACRRHDYVRAPCFLEREKVRSVVDQGRHDAVPNSTRVGMRCVCVCGGGGGKWVEGSRVHSNACEPWPG
jgi:hypothetical protein